MTLDLDLGQPKPEAEKDYREETTYSKQFVNMDTNFSDGSIKITPEITSAIKIAIESRIRYNKKYTDERLEQVKANTNQYYSSKDAINDNKSLAKMFLPETYNSAEDWSDDLYLMFDKMIDDLEVSDIGDTVEEFLVKSLPMTENEGNKSTGFLRSFTNFLMQKQNVMNNETYYIRKADAIKSMLERCLHRSGYKTKIETFFMLGILSGIFILKDDWGPTGEYKLCHKDSGGKSYDLDQEDVYRFCPVDSRMMIFPKEVDSRTGKWPWCIEKINTSFHSLLDMILDEDNKPVDGTRYDIDMVKKLGDHLLVAGSNTVKAGSETIFGDSDDSDTDINDLYDIDGSITLYECHSIPLLIENDGKKKPYKCMITCVNLNEEGKEEPNLYPIGCQMTPYISGLPYLTANFGLRDGDSAGRGLPEILKPIQDMINNFASHSIDIMNLALWGIMVIDPDVLKDEAKLKEIQPRLLLKLKDMRGRRVEDVIQWLHPKVETLNYSSQMLEQYLYYLQKTSRKGPTGEKINPNPSATEFASMMQEMQKSVNKVGIRLNNLFSTMLERMYIYNILNMKQRIALKTQSYRIIDPTEDIMGKVENGEYASSDKSIELTPDELFIDGLNFKLSAADSYNKRAVEKQQLMQLTSMLMTSGLLRNVDGTPVIMQDESGANVVLSDYKLIKKLLDSFDYSDIFKKLESDPSMVSPVVEGDDSGQGGQPGQVNAPPLSASPDMANILQQSNTVDPGVI